MDATRAIPPSEKFAWVRDPDQVRAKWQTSFDHFKKQQEERPQDLPIDIQFPEIPEEVYQALVDLPDDALPLIEALIQRIEEFPYSQKVVLKSQAKLSDLVSAFETGSDENRRRYEHYFHEDLNKEVPQLCAGSLNLERSRNTLQNFFDRILEKAGKKKIYNTKSPDEEPTELPPWSPSSGPAYAALPSFARQAVDRLTGMYETDNPLPKKYWDQFWGKSNKVDFNILSGGREKLAAVLIVLNDFGAFMAGRPDSRLPILERKR